MRFIIRKTPIAGGELRPWGTTLKSQNSRQQKEFSYSHIITYLISCLQIKHKNMFYHQDK